MNRMRTTRLYPAIVLQGIALGGATAGCGGTGHHDAAPGPTTVFSWQPSDAGADAGSATRVDAGGAVPRDAGMRHDAGTMPDAGNNNPVIDAGWRPTK